MARQELRPLVDLALGGTLEQWLRDHVAAGNSTYTIRDVLRDAHGIEVSAETVRTWCDHYGITLRRAAS
jgi:hypothetical protein